MTSIAKLVHCLSVLKAMITNHVCSLDGVDDADNDVIIPTSRRSADADRHEDELIVDDVTRSSSFVSLSSTITSPESMTPAPESMTSRIASAPPGRRKPIADVIDDRDDDVTPRPVSAGQKRSDGAFRGVKSHRVSSASLETLQTTNHIQKGQFSVRNFR